MWWLELKLRGLQISKGNLISRGGLSGRGDSVLKRQMRETGAKEVIEKVWDVKGEKREGGGLSAGRWKERWKRKANELEWALRPLRSS